MLYIYSVSTITARPRSLCVMGANLRQVEGAASVQDGALDLLGQDFLVGEVAHLQVLYCQHLCLGGCTSRGCQLT